MVTRAFLAIALAATGCSTSDNPSVAAQINIHQPTDDPATTTIELEAEGTIDRDQVLAYLPGLDVRIELDGVVVALPEVSPGKYQAARVTGMPAQLVLVADGESLALAHSGPTTATIAPIPAGYRLTFTPRAPSEYVDVLWIGANGAVTSERMADGVSSFDLPADATRGYLWRFLTTDEGGDDGLRLGGNVTTIRDFTIP